MYKFNGELFSCDITDSESELHPERATYQTLHTKFWVNGLSKFAQNFTVRFLRLLSTAPNSTLLYWGNFPFKGNQNPHITVTFIVNVLIIQDIISESLDKIGQRVRRLQHLP